MTINWLQLLLQLFGGFLGGGTAGVLTVRHLKKSALMQTPLPPPDTLQAPA